jgi:hypothetical protein
MMVEIETVTGDKQLIGIDCIRHVVKHKSNVSDADDEPLAVLYIEGMSGETVLKHSYDAFKRVLDGGGVKIIRG